MVANLIKYLSLFVVVFLGLILVLSHASTANAQVCSGTWEGRVYENLCLMPDGITTCAITGIPAGCVCVEFCPSTFTTFNCNTITDPTVCSTYGQGLNTPLYNPGLCDDYGNGYCNWVNPTSTPVPTSTPIPTPTPGPTATPTLTPTPTSPPPPTPTDIPGCVPACGPTESCVQDVPPSVPGDPFGFRCVPDPPTSTPIPPTPTSQPNFSIGGTVFEDTNENGVQDCVGPCNGQSGDELGYQGATVSITGATPKSDTTNPQGDYSMVSLNAGTYTVTLTVPVGYGTTTTNPRSPVVIGPDQTINFGIILTPVPDCPGGLSGSPSTVDAGGTSSLSVSGCIDVENPDDGNPPPPFDWDPPIGTNPECNDGIDNDGDGNIDTADSGCHTDGDPGNPATYNPTDDSESSGSSACIDGGTTNQVDTSTSSSADWNAPACPPAQIVCNPQVTVSGVGGSTIYSSAITVNSTYGITANVQEDLGFNNCASGSAPYTATSVNFLLFNTDTGGSTNQSTSTGTTDFLCQVDATYQLTMGVPSGYDVVNRTVSPGPSTNILTNGVQFDSGPSQTATFCISNADPWYQTTTGDVRFNQINNPVPAGQYASTDVTSPGISYSSDFNADLGSGGASTKGWLVNDEYAYNANTRNRNGTLTYGFYKSRARREGVTINPLDANAPNVLENLATGLYEVAGDLVISSGNPYTHTSGARVVILVSGNVTISTDISVPVGDGLLVIAATEDITINSGVGQSILSSTVSNLDGYYAAQGSIVIESIDNGCSTGISDNRLNVGGALIANALKPFSNTGTGTVQNQRSLCTDNANYPALYVDQRPDFLTKLTSFYKTSYTKWTEVNP